MGGLKNVEETGHDTSSGEASERITLPEHETEKSAMPKRRRQSLREFSSNISNRLRALTNSLRPPSFASVALEIPPTRSRSSTPDLLLNLDTSIVKQRLSMAYPATENYDVLRFDVSKIRGQAKRQKRTLEINSKKLLLTNYDGRILKKQFSIAQIEKIEVLDRKEKDVIVHFIKQSNKPYHLKFANKLDRDMFSDVLKACMSVVNPTERSEGHGAMHDLRKFNKLLASDGLDEEASDKAQATNLNIFVSTFNVGDAPPPESFDGWLPSSNSPYDIICIGLQECSYRVSSDFVDARDHFEKRVRKFIGPDYILVSKTVHWDRALLIYCRGSLSSLITSVETDYVSTGVAGILGNKGGMATKFRIHEQTFCVINSHLAAHARNVEARNANYREIVSSLKIGRKQFDILHQFHHIIWMGDLNYRVSMTGGKAVKLIRTCEWDEMLEKDQLRAAMRAGDAFDGFSEGKIDFAPTFRLSRKKNGDSESDEEDDEEDDDEKEAVAAVLMEPADGEELFTNVRDDSDTDDEYGQDLVRVSDAVRAYSKIKTRTPSWCDRILWKSLPGCHLRQVDLFSCQNILSSDHCPVVAVFNTTIPQPSVRQGVNEEVNVVFESLEISLEASPGGPRNIYMKFFANFLEKPYPKTPAIKKSPGEAELHWRPSLLPALKPYALSPNVLEGDFLLVLIRDDFGKKGHNPIIGQAVIPLNGITSRLPLRFDRDVGLHGLCVGRLRGIIRMC